MSTRKKFFQADGKEVHINFDKNEYKKSTNSYSWFPLTGRRNINISLGTSAVHHSTGFNAVFKCRNYSELIEGVYKNYSCQQNKYI